MHPAPDLRYDPLHARRGEVNATKRYSRNPRLRGPLPGRDRLGFGRFCPVCAITDMFPLSRGRVSCARRFCIGKATEIPHGKAPETPSLRSVASRDDPWRDAVPLLRQAPRLRPARRRAPLGSSPSRVLSLAPGGDGRQACRERDTSGTSREATGYACFKNASSLLSAGPGELVGLHPC